MREWMEIESARKGWWSKGGVKSLGVGLHDVEMCRHDGKTSRVKVLSSVRDVRSVPP